MSDAWNAGGSSGPPSSDSFKPNSLESGFFSATGFGSVGSLGPLDVEGMDMGADEIDLPFPPLPLVHTDAPRQLWPQRPGPSLPRVIAPVFRDLLTPTMSVSQGSMELLNKIYHFQSEQRVNLEKLRMVQIHLLQRPTAGGFQAVASQEAKMKDDTHAALNVLVQIWCNCLLSPWEIWRWDFLWADLHVQARQLQLYIDELAGFASQSPDWQCQCALVIISQPFPTVSTRGRAIDGKPMVVQLLTGSTVDIADVSPVTANCVVPRGTKGKLTPDLIENQTATLQAETCDAEFRIKFANGTRKQPVYFTFSLTINVRTEVGQKQLHLTSADTPSTISVTNEVQWEEAEGILIESVAFKDNETCSWPNLVNHLQRHIIEATRQQVDELHRIFSLAELSYFHTTFFGGGPTVTVDAYREWFKWYGKAAHKIRYTKHILPLYLGGQLFGFIGKDQMERALHNQPPGTFMIRFSERNPGSFSIAYVLRDAQNSSQTMVRHYLVSHEDITQRKSLADFLGESPALTHFLRYDPRSGFNLNFATHTGPRYVLQEKHLALQEFYAHREEIQQTSGYDSQLVTQPPIAPSQQAQQQQRNASGGMPVPLPSGGLLSVGMGLAPGETSPSLFRTDLPPPPPFGMDADSYWDAE